MKTMPDFQKVALTSEIPKGGMKKILKGSQQVLLANVNGKF
jgi:hypothetical protein